ncbi:MAG: thioredoxin family protein [Saprospiraceae bacterium]|nr:thioredoxin family protein [Saprospiraceae bacterium]
MDRKNFWLFVIMLFIQNPTWTQPVNQPIELGRVHWIRNLDEGLSKSAKLHKPVFLLFQEVPGCSTCRNFGSNVLDHPLIAEAIEDHFIPVAIYNNIGGHDADVLKRYNEPSWNNPVVHILSGKGSDLIPKLQGRYSEGDVISLINKALLSSSLLIPAYLQLLEAEYTANPEEMILEMYCFWSGEKNIGGQPGVIYTEPGYSQGKEVVKVRYDRNLTDATNVAKAAKKGGNADAIHTGENALIDMAKAIGMPVKKAASYSIDKDLHYYLKNSILSAVPMTQTQATKINSALGNGQLAENYLSPRQIKILDAVKSGKLKNIARYHIAPVAKSWPASF